MTDFHSALNQLNQLWRDLETKLKGIPLKKSDFALSIERYGDLMRLCYNGKPITDCKAVEKVEAVDLVDTLLEHLTEETYSLNEKVRAASKHLEHILILLD